MEAISLFRAIKPFKLNPNLTESFCVRCSSSSSATKVHTGERTGVKRQFDGLLLDAAGTLLQLAKPVEETYAAIGKNYGLSTPSAVIKKGFKRAFSASWAEELRYQGDGRPFWKFIVSEATGCNDNAYFEEVYQHYANGDAWRLPDRASDTLSNLKDCGVKLAVVSNFDTRLRKLLKDLNVVHLFDAVIVSAEVGYEKPDAKIFQAALDQICVETTKAVHVGDDAKADKEGANAAGIECWLWGRDVKSFADIQSAILIES
ncbi:unnamed protein product [Cuscuta epithymum]|uniref:Haloacid dehalogenase-like hydrolase domain-containing protein 3 n=2 Tax=Cuscuta epithymum TaxID=186058 RepID=A0AAV0DAH2_9ASTE|nr:unnamed protein product [Cuscuta epithymum]CAH9123921.1 unnamed protein product [Cuscuta epithymum]